MSIIAKFVLAAMTIATVVLFVVGLVVAVPVKIEPSYVATVKVDSPEKIEHALSNAVNDVVSRKFIVTEICIKHVLYSSSYIIHIGGNDQKSLMSQ